jgi:hypothetical protein
MIMFDWQGTHGGQKINPSTSTMRDMPCSAWQRKALPQRPPSSDAMAAQLLLLRQRGWYKPVKIYQFGNQITTCLA